jgi:RimJ/RimL family protein N-acetyltransferase
VTAPVSAFQELGAADRAAARSLLTGEEQDLYITAVLEDTCRGTVWVDDRSCPRTALLVTPEGHFLIGERPEGEAAQALTRLLAETLLRGREQGWWCLCLAYPGEEWQDLIATAVAAGFPVWFRRPYFVCRQLKIDWRVGMPEGFTMARLDAPLLARDDLTNVSRLRDWASEDFGSIPAFLERGFGFCAIRGQDIASWCLSDCVSGHRCEIGIHTAEAFRRRGLAARTAAAAVEHCLANGLTHIGWHTWSGNIGSAATARAVGFEQVGNGHAVHVWFGEIDSLLVQGNIHLTEGRYAAAAECYQRALTAAESASPSRLLQERADHRLYRYKAAVASALAGDREAGARQLGEALDAGTERWRMC